MNEQLKTAIKCCEKLTESKIAFIKAVEDTTGLTKQGQMKNKLCYEIIKKRS